MYRIRLTYSDGVVGYINTVFDTPEAAQRFITRSLKNSVAIKIEVVPFS